MSPSKNGDPAHVGDVIAGMVDRGSWRERLAAGRLKTAWPAIVGEAIAAHCEPVKIAGGVLLVRSEPGSWATELSLLAKRIATLADQHLGGGLVREIKVVAGRM